MILLKSSLWFFKRLALLIVACVVFLSASAADVFVRTSGTKIIGRDGKSVALRGVNIGNWMIREPYMMGTSLRQFQFDKMIADICGEDKVAEFDKMWLDNLFTEEDMRFVADNGFNTLRVPMYYKYFTLPIEKEPVSGEQTWLDEGFTRIDSLVAWAERNGMYLILDMHACPGGQSPGDICDYDESKPSLWDSEANRTKLIALWRKIAERYKDEKCIAGYDLINEPAWDLPNDYKLLWDTQKAIIKAIREVDSNHIVILEGNWYCNDYKGLPATKMDSKLVLQFHRYWNHNTSGTIQYMIDLTTKYNCPAFIGEFGENSNTWVADNIRLCEEVGRFAAWTVWPYKKPGTSCFMESKRPTAYDNVIKQYQNGTKPSSATLWNGLKSWATAQNFSKCTPHKDFIDALLVRGFRKPSFPYVEATVGDYIYMPNFDYGSAGETFYDTDDGDYHSSENGVGTGGNVGGCYRNDGVDIYSGVNDSRSCGYYVGQTRDGEWMQYTLHNPNEAAKWRLMLRYALNSGTSTIRITVNDRTVVAPTKLSSTGGYTTWTTKTFRDILLPEGDIRVRIYIEKGGANFNWFAFSTKSAATEEELASLRPDTSGGRNLLGSGDCEFQGPWRFASVGSPHSYKLTWNATASTPSQGQGGALCVENLRENTTINCAIYQPVEVVRGHTYRADFAVRGTSTNKDFWIQPFITKNEPVDYADKDLSDANTIGQLNSWKDASLAAYDGLMSEKALPGTSHTMGKMKWRATTSGTMYFVVKIGSSSTSGFKYTFDNFSLIDETAEAEERETGIDIIEEDVPLYRLEGNNVTLSPSARLYNVNGQQVAPRHLSSGVYVVTDGKSSQKLMVR